jgi:DUF4097 and DUF4098 domain-containing protein YvlB
MRITFRLLLLTTIAGATLALAHPAAAESYSRTYHVSGRAHVTVDAQDAQVRIITWDRPEVSVQADTRGWHFGDDGHVESTQNGDDVRVTSRVSHSWIGFSITIHDLRVVVSMPAKGDVDIVTGDGGVEVEPLTGRLNVRTGDGSIRVHGAHGDITLDTGDGGIDAEDLDGTLDAHTNDGHIYVNGRFDSLELGSGDGRITADVEKGSALARAWSMRTSDGPIVLRVPDGLKCDLEARTGDGHITLDMPVEVDGRFDHSHLDGRLNGGGPPLRLQSGDGSIRIGRL